MAAKSTDNPHEGHRARLRERYRKTGSDNLEDHELLELLLFNSLPRCDTNALAHRLINQFGSFDKVFDAEEEQLVNIGGVGEKTAFFLSLIPHILRRYLASQQKPLSAQVLRTTEDLVRFAKPHYIGIPHERLYMLSMTGNAMILDFSLISEGSATMTFPDTSSCVRTALDCCASQVVFFHNHPDGDTTPSRQDRDWTDKIYDTFSSLGIRMTDHIILTTDSYHSMSASRQVPIFPESVYEALDASDRE